MGKKTTTGEKKVPVQPLKINKIIHEPIRLLIMSQLFVVDKADMIFLRDNLDLTWGNLASHLSKLEAKEYVEIEKKFVGKKTQTVIKMTDLGREEFLKYKQIMKDLFF